MKKSKLSYLYLSYFNAKGLKKLIWFTCSFFALLIYPLQVNAGPYVSHAMQKGIEVSGKVTSADGQPLPGVSILLKGTTKGTLSGSDGKYKITVDNTSSVLVFKFVGMKSQEITVGTRSVIDVTMQDAQIQLGEIVVTALGIKRQEKSLSYSTQQVKGDQLTAIPTMNMMNALAGKAAGVNISSSAAGIGSSTKVILRGYTSIQGNNQPLYVVDGMPLANVVPSQVDGGGSGSTNMGNGFGGGVDAGDGISNLNPEDIESISILKGGAASALYGSQAANGVIVITTKSGRSGKTEINVNSSFQLDQPDIRYKFQNHYGVSGSTESWGAKKSFTDNHVKDYFNTGYSWINAISFSGGNDKSQNYLSYSYNKGSGLVPTNDIQKHTLTLHNTSEFFKGLLKIDGKTNILFQDMNNPPSAPGEYFNPIKSVYLFPRGNDFNSYKNNYEVYDPIRSMYTQNWFDQTITQNPYWITNKVPTTAKRTRMTVDLGATLKLTSWLTFKARGSADKSWDDYERKAYAGTMLTLASKNGKYQVSHNTDQQYYGDLLLIINKNWNDLSLDATLGSSVTDVRSSRFNIDSDTKGLYYANLFTITNMVSGGKYRTEDYSRSQLQSVFGTVSLGYKSMIYVDATGRNDWSSTLPKANDSYFYPSVGLSFLLNELLSRTGSLPSAIDYIKLRGSYTEIGHSIPPYVFHQPEATVNETGTIIYNTTESNDQLKPERSKSTELGLETKFFKDRLSFDFTYYNSNTEDQYFPVAAPPASGYSTLLVNGGKVSNKGVEMTLGITPVQSNNFTWNTRFNFSANKSKIEELPDQYKTAGSYTLSNEFYSLVVREGGEYGEMYSYKNFKRVNGKLVLVKNTDGTYAPEVFNDTVKVGTINPKFRLSWSNSLNYKNLSLSFLIDGRFGGKVISNTQATMSQYGVSKETGDARDNGGVSVNGVVLDASGNVTSTYNGKIDAETYYKTAPISEYAYDATNVRLREVSLGYTLPKSLFLHANFIKDVRLSLIARNLFFFYIKAPYDPESTISTTQNSMLNMDNFGVPTTRSFGFSLNVKF